MTKKTTVDSSVLDTPVIDTPVVEDKPVKPKKKAAAKKKEPTPVTEIESQALAQESNGADSITDDANLDLPEIGFEDPHHPEDFAVEPTEPHAPIADDSAATTPNSDSELTLTHQSDAEQIASTDTDVKDAADDLRYHRVQFSGLQVGKTRAFGAISITSQGMFDIPSVVGIIMQNHGCTDVAISGWQVIESREVFDAIHGDVEVDDTGKGVSYYHVHYILTDGEGRQVFGHTPAQTAGILNLKAIGNYLANLYNTNPESVVVTSWQPLANIEEFAALNRFNINTVDSTQNEQ